MSVSLVGGVKHPKIYAYTVMQFDKTAWVGGRSGEGLIKIGETERSVEVRIREQLNAVKMPEESKFNVLIVESAITDDGRVFSDKEVHKALRKAGFHNVAGEWFECTKEEVLSAIRAVRNGESLPSVRPVFDFKMRPEQERAVATTAAYFREHIAVDGDQPPDFLWNAKMRFGKTFTTYQLAKTLHAKRVLVLTSNRRSKTHGRPI